MLTIGKLAKHCQVKCGNHSLLSTDRSDADASLKPQNYRYYSQQDIENFHNKKAKMRAYSCSEIQDFAAFTVG